MPIHLHIAYDCFHITRQELLQQRLQGLLMLAYTLFGPLQKKKKKMLPSGIEEAKGKQIHGGSGKEIQCALPLQVKSTYSR